MTIKLNQGHFAALALLLGVIVWILAGQFKDKEPFENTRPLAIDSGLQRVQAEHLQGQLMQRDVSFSAFTAANRSVEVRTEVAGKVVSILKEKGSRVNKGDIIIELDKRSRPERVEQAKANLEQRQIETNSTQKLAERGLANDSQLALAKTALANAKAEYTQAKIQLDGTVIRAPFDGILDQQYVEVGDFIRDNTPVVKVIDPSPWLVKGQVAEREVADIHLGDAAWAKLGSGKQVRGHIRFIAAEADARTRTFAVEMEVSDSNFLGAGLTATLNVPQAETSAYYVSPALLVLSDDGRLGLKGLNSKNQVIFLPIELLKADDKGMWVYGPESGSVIITVGQGFVEYGQTVEPVFKENSPE